MKRHRATRAEVDAAAITANVEALRQHVPGAELCAVVKADGYGHGAVVAAGAALAGGATWLAVALVEEALELRAAGFEVPILVLSEPPATAWAEVVAGNVDATVYTAAAVAVADATAAAAGSVARVHLKVDTGMHRVGCPSEVAVGLAADIGDRASLRLAGVFTHLATADDPSSAYSSIQLERFDAVLGDLEAAGITGFLRHAANSAAAIALPAARFDLVRCGIACYGVPPSPALADLVELRPAMRLVSTVSHVQRLAAGEPVSYGCRYVTSTETTVATVPIGYADGVPRSLGQHGGVALVRGVRVRVVGTVTMDQLMLDVGDLPVEPGDEVVLLGSQGTERLDAEEIAARVGTIGYEIVTRIGPRVPRVAVDGLTRRQ